MKTYKHHKSDMVLRRGKTLWKCIRCNKTVHAFNPGHAASLMPDCTVIHPARLATPKQAKYLNVLITGNAELAKELDLHSSRPSQMTRDEAHKAIHLMLQGIETASPTKC